MTAHREASAGEVFEDFDEEPHARIEPATHTRVAESFKCTETGNAERFVAMHGGRVRFCTAWKKWLLWDGTRWTVDSRGEVMRLAKIVVRSIYAEAARCGDDDMRKAIAQWARKSESLGGRRALLQLAESEAGIAVLPDELDRDPWLLNTPTHTIDLKNGVAREHRRDDLITKRTGAAFEGTARSPLWDRVLLEAMGDDPELVAFFQRAAGYSITGDTGEEKLFLVHGRAGSSKSTIIQAISAALGDYAKTADFEAFLDKKNAGGPKNEIARLAGARFVPSIEVDKGKRLAQGLVKTLTGGDVVTARFLYQEAFEFRPTFHLWLVANDAPVVPDDDTGLWRRILLIPLDRPVPANKRDPAVKAELVDVTCSGAAVLAWLVAGCVQWQAKGLAVPRAVTEATDAYRSEQDPLRGFLEDCCLFAPHAQCTRKQLRTAYEAWVDVAGGRTPLTGQDFNDRIRKLDERGVSEKIVKGVRSWVGIDVYEAARPHFGAVDPRTGERSDDQ